MVALAQPIMRALFWTQARFPAIQSILNPHNINTFKEWYWIVCMKMDMAGTVKRIQEECEMDLSHIENGGEDVHKALVIG